MRAVSRSCWRALQRRSYKPFGLLSTRTPGALLNLTASQRKLTTSAEGGNDRSFIEPASVWTQGTNNPLVLVAPARYVQGEGTCDHIGRYVGVLPSKKPVVVLSKGRHTSLKKRLDAAFSKYSVEPTYILFEGECSFEEAERIMALMDDMSEVDSVIAVGGGKCLDMGKVLAHWRQCPMVSVPTVASNDAPCTSFAAMYTPEGELSCLSFVRKNPDLVVVDSGVVAKAPVRLFAAGMADAMATFYEASVCFHNPKTRNCVGANITLTALALAELCKDTLYLYGVAAKESVESDTVSGALEKCIEANTLLSGMGFESGGLSMAHTVAGSLTAIRRIDAEFLHGEHVAMGTLTQLVMEKKTEESERCARFLKEIGLPISFQQMGLDVYSPESEDMGAFTTSFMSADQVFRDTMPFEVTPELVIESMQNVDALATKIRE